MPAMTVQMSIRGWWDGTTQNMEAERKIKIPADRQTWIEVHAEQEYTLMVFEEIVIPVLQIFYKCSPTCFNTLSRNICFRSTCID